MRCWHDYQYEQHVNDVHMVQLLLLPPHHLLLKIQIGLTFLVLAYLGSPGKEAVTWVSVGLSVSKIRHINEKCNSTAIIAPYCLLWLVS